MDALELHRHDGRRFNDHADCVTRPLFHPAPGATHEKIPATHAHRKDTVGTDFSHVTVFEGDEATGLNALAFARGDEVHFAPGRFDPGTPDGRELLAHELAHVAQQREGRVGASGPGRVNKYASLESEADAIGQRAATDEAREASTSQRCSSTTNAVGPTQRAGPPVIQLQEIAGQPEAESPCVIFEGVTLNNDQAGLRRHLEQLIEGGGIDEALDFVERFEGFAETLRDEADDLAFGFSSDWGSGSSEYEDRPGAPASAQEVEIAEQRAQLAASIGATLWQTVADLEEELARLETEHPADPEITILQPPESAAVPGEVMREYPPPDYDDPPREMYSGSYRPGELLGPVERESLELEFMLELGLALLFEDLPGYEQLIKPGGLIVGGAIYQLAAIYVGAVKVGIEFFEDPPGTLAAGWEFVCAVYDDAEARGESGEAALINLVNPVYHLLVLGSELFDAVGEGDYVAIGRQGTNIGLLLTGVTEAYTAVRHIGRRLRSAPDSDATRQPGSAVESEGTTPGTAAEAPDGDAASTNQQNSDGESGARPGGTVAGREAGGRTSIPESIPAEVSAAPGVRPEATHSLDSGTLGRPNTQIHMGQQGKHIPGHPNFDPSLGRSVLTVDPESLRRAVGTGTPANKVPRGQPGFRERVNFDEVIGDYVRDGVATPTRNGIIHYGKKGIHIVPAAP